MPSTETLTAAFFNIATREVMAIVIFIGVAIHLFRAISNSPHPRPKPRHARILRVFNWSVWGMVYIVDSIVSVGFDSTLFIRMWYRLAVIIIVIGEIGYYSEAVLDVADLTGKQIVSTANKLKLVLSKSVKKAGKWKHKVGQ